MSIGIAGSVLQSPHWIIAPVLLPLATAALMLLMGDAKRSTRAAINVASTLAGLVLAVLLLHAVDQQQMPAAYGVYLPGDWPVPFGIVLVIDRLAAMMCVLVGVVGLSSLLYALARWQQAGVYFHVLFQLQLMGLYGAFTTGDLFNLFVFFEVLLAASYALLLHGGGTARVRAGLHYIAINLMASLLFLLGVAVVYGVTGSLNMADIALKIPAIPESDRGLLHAGAALLGVAFVTKAALWPLNFWLPSAYTAASAPVAALFAILTKVGVYVVLRMWTLCFPATAGASALFGGEALFWGGAATLVFGSMGMLASQTLGRIAAFSIIASSGTLIAAIGINTELLSGGALFYLASSTLAGGTLFLLVELLDRVRQMPTPLQLYDDGDMVLPSFGDEAAMADINLDDDEEALIGRPFPAALAFLGLSFAICALVVSGLPPLSGFIAKLAMLSALVDVDSVDAWLLFGLLIGSGLFATIALIRNGIRHFWTTHAMTAPRLRLVEGLPVILLLGATIGMVVQGEGVLRYMQNTAASLHDPSLYIRAVTIEAGALGGPVGERP